MIHTRDMRALVSRGVSGIVPGGGGTWMDDSTGRVVTPYGNGTYLDSSGEVLDQSGNVVSRQAGAVSADSSSSSLADELAGILGGVAAVGKVVGGIVRPTPPPQQSAPWTTGEKVALGVAIGVPVVGLGAYAAGLFSGPKRRRRR